MWLYTLQKLSIAQQAYIKVLWCVIHEPWCCIDGISIMKYIKYDVTEGQPTTSKKGRLVRNITHMTSEN